MAVIALTADRGLCGAFNSNIIRRALELVDKYTAEGVDSDLVVMGRKGVSTVRFQGYRIDKAYLDVTERTAFLEAQALTNGIIRRYANESIDRVHLVFNRFKSPMEQFVTDQVILPIQEEITSSLHPSRRPGAHGLPLRAFGGGDPGRSAPLVRRDHHLSGPSWRAWPASTAPG